MSITAADIEKIAKLARIRVEADAVPELTQGLNNILKMADQLQAIERLIARLDATEAGEADPVPAEFRTLWETFRIALEARESVRGR